MNPRLPLTFLAVLFGSGASGELLADIYLRITDGQSWAKQAAMGTPGFNLSKSTSPGNMDTLEFLQCGSATCKIFFPSGMDMQQPDDTFLFLDTGRAYVRKSEPNAGQIELGGVEITALRARDFPHVFLTFGTTPGDITRCSGGSGSYSGATVLEGAFAKEPPSGGSTTKTTSCKDSRVSDADLLSGILNPPCVRLQLWVDNGSNKELMKKNRNTLPTAESASIPCNTSRNGPNFCGAGDYFPGQTPSFSAELTWKTTCVPGHWPAHQATLYAKFNVDQETLAPSDYFVMSTLPEEGLSAAGAVGGAEQVGITLANDPKKRSDYWLSFAALEERFRAVELKVAEAVPGKVRFSLRLNESIAMPAKSGVKLTSIATIPQTDNKGDNALPATERLRNDRSYASFISKPTLRWNDVEVLSFDYGVLIGSDEGPADPRLPDKLSFSDCENGSVRVMVKVAGASGKDEGFTIYLGPKEHVLSGCKQSESIAKENLLSNEDMRVEPSIDPKGNEASFMTIKAAQSKFGERYLRSVSLIVDAGVKPVKEPKHYGVQLREAKLKPKGADAKPFLATNSLTTIDLDSYVLVSPPASGRHILLTRVETNPAEPLVTITDAEITNEGYELKATKTDARLTAGTYRVDLCISGGRCIPNQDRLTIK